MNSVGTPVDAANVFGLVVEINLVHDVWNVKQKFLIATQSAYCTHTNTHIRNESWIMMRIDHEDIDSCVHRVTIPKPSSNTKLTFAVNLLSLFLPLFLRSFHSRCQFVFWIDTSLELHALCSRMSRTTLRYKRSLCRTNNSITGSTNYITLLMYDKIIFPFH